MPITAETKPYEILIRFTNGAPTGCHYKTIEIVSDGERVYGATESEAMPIEGEAVADVLGEVLQAALLRISALEQQLAELADAESDATLALAEQL